MVVGSGICSICGLVFRVVPSSGVLRRHGNVGSGPPCPGSGLLPGDSSQVGSTQAGSALDRSGLLDEGMCHSPGSMSSAESSDDTSEVFSISPASARLVKHIPRAARYRAAVVFESCLRDVSAVGSLASWERLFRFPTSLRQPARGGRRFNLSSQILAQLDRFDSGDVLPSLAPAPRRTRRGATAPHAGSPDEEAAKRASIKLGLGDVTGAIRALISDCSYVPPDTASHHALLQKHPPAPADRRPAPSARSDPCSCSVQQVLAALRSFHPGSSSGFDGLSPQHLQDMVQMSGPEGLPTALTNFMNLVLSGGVPQPVRHVFFGANLHALRKKDGGIRPIAVGLTLRRLASKIVCRWAADRLLPDLAPRQLGVGVRGGAEAIVHAARAFVSSASPCHALVKLDLVNAFNSVRRDCIFEMVADRIPEILPFVVSAYETSSSLYHGSLILQSSEGVQQGDPLGPLLFSLAISPALEGSQCIFTTAYLDDITLGDTVETLGREVAKLQAELSKVGLTLNESKCEIIALAEEARPCWNSFHYAFSEPPTADTSLLGSPLFSNGFTAALGRHLNSFSSLAGRLQLLSAHEAFYLYSNSLSMPKWLHLLRSAPCWNSPALGAIDDVQCSTLSDILNVPFTDATWTQASLPVRWGGLGVRDIQDLAPSAFLASAHLARPLVSLLLPPIALASFEASMSEALRHWGSLGEVSPPGPSLRSMQRAWDDSICGLRMHQLLHSSSVPDRARLLASGAPGSGSWIQALPSANLGLRLSNQEIRISAGLRLGAQIVSEHTCACGTRVLPDGRHGLSCKKSAGRHSRHHAVNDIIARTLRSIGIPAILEPPGLLRGDGKRPDGTTLIPWSGGRSMLWDFTCPDTLAPSHLHKTTVLAGAAASEAEARKTLKYSDFLHSHKFIPVAVETLGVWGPQATELITDLGKRLTESTRDARSTRFLRQRIAIAVQRGNTASVLGTFPVSVSGGEFPLPGDGDP